MLFPTVLSQLLSASLDQICYLFSGTPGSLYSFHSRFNLLPSCFYLFPSCFYWFPAGFFSFPSRFSSFHGPGL